LFINEVKITKTVILRQFAEITLPEIRPAVGTEMPSRCQAPVI
jgi:hypothetical protein